MASETHNGYGKRSIGQWVVIYLILAAIVYGGYYYLYAGKGYNAAALPSTSTNNTTGTTPTTPGY